MKTAEARHDQSMMFRHLEPMIASRFTLAKAERVFSTDDPTRGLFWLESGLVRLTRHAADGKEVTLHVARPGESFAEASLFAERYHCDAVADLPSAILAVEKAKVLAAIASNPIFAQDWTKHLSLQVQTLRTQVELMGLKSAGDRILAYLRARSSDSSTFTLDRPWKSIATDVGLTHEALYRTLARLEWAGHIVRGINRSTIVLKRDSSR